MQLISLLNVFVAAVLLLVLLVTQPCQTLCDPVNVAHQAPLSMEISRPEHWSGVPCLPGGPPDPGIKRRPAALQTDSSPSESAPEGSAAKLCPALCDPMDCSTLGFPALHYLLEFAQIHVH